VDRARRRPAVRVRLKGINSRTKRRADGSERTYWWAWKGGPPLKGEPGSPAFVASYHEAHAAKIAPAAGVLAELTRYFEGTTEFADLAERTKADYRGKIALVEAEFGDMPLAALDDRRTRGVFKEWRDGLAKKSKRQADYAWVVLARVLSVAKDRRKIATNPCEKGRPALCGLAPRHGVEPGRRKGVRRGGAGPHAPSALARGFGPGNGEAISYGCPGQRTMAPTPVCANRRPALACASRWWARSRPL